MKKKRINIIAAVILSLLFIIGCGGGGGDSQTVIAEPKISLSESSYDFGGIVVKNSAERQFTITNTGNRDLRITSFSSSDAQFTVPEVSDNCSGKSVAPNGSCTFITRFTPAAHGAQGGTISITADDPATILLQGDGWLNVWINRITGNCASISIDVTVTDPLSLERLGSLTKDNFILTLGSVTQTINVSANIFPDPVSVVLALDMSPSQTANISTIKLAAQSFIDQLRDSDEAAICMFSTLREFYPESTPYFLPTDNDGEIALNTYIQDYSTTSGETTLYDSIYESITRAADNGINGKKAVVVLSDGVDTASTLTLTEVVDYAKLKGVLLFTIFYVDASYYPAATADTLKQLASDTGGQYYNSGNSDDLTVIFEEIAKSLSNKYIITYTPSSCISGSTIYPQVQVNWEGKHGQTSGKYTMP
jgi:VWFA-related protein